tara:strand:- start:358 stop:1341 length:984 start_codon:yes stop_codon:yes gene_type:complete
MIEFIFPWKHLDNETSLIAAVKEAVTNTSTTKVIIFNPEEHEPPWYFQRHRHIINRLCKKHKVTIEYWLQNIAEEDFFEDCASINHINWPLFCAYYTAAQINITETVTDIDRLFVCLNHRAHKERCELMDQLENFNLVKNGYISWLKKDAEKFTFKYFLNKKMVLDYDSHQDGFTFPVQYYNGLINIIPESTIKTIDFSEKTFGAILNEKPFIILGAPGIHKKLKDLGFKLFDEYLFDYSFDKEPDLHKRINLIVKEIRKHRSSDYNELYKKVLPKIKHNKTHLLKLINNKKNIPKQFEEYYDNQFQDYFKRADFKYIDNVTKDIIN